METKVPAQAKYHDKHQIRIFCQQIRESVGDGWKWMVPDVQRAIVSDKIISMVCQGTGSISVEAVKEMRTAMMVEMGCWEK